jgi:hypothetical protein
MRWVLKRVRVSHLPVKAAKETRNIDHFARKRYVLSMPAVEFTTEPDEKPVAGAAREEDGKTYECDAAADRRGWEIVLRARQ